MEIFRTSSETLLFSIRIKKKQIHLRFCFDFSIKRFTRIYTLLREEEEEEDKNNDDKKTNGGREYREWWCSFF